MTATDQAGPFTLHGSDVVEQLKRLVHEGNVRRITIRDRDGNVIFHAPLTVGVVGVALIPVWAAVGAVVALSAECTIEVERGGDTTGAGTPPAPAGR